MIRWILNRKWLSISLYASAIFLISAGSELVNLNLNGLLFSLAIAAAVFFSRILSWVSILLVPVAGFLLVTFSSAQIIGLFELGFVILFLSAFGETNQRRWANVTAALTAIFVSWTMGYQKQSLQALVGESQQVELARVNSLLFVLAFTTLLFLSAILLGRLFFLKMEHVGTPQDQALAAISRGRLRLEIAKQNERLGIAKDLSELLVQRISAVVSITEGGRYALASDPSSAERVLDRAYESGRSAQAELRRLYDYLNSAIISDVAIFRISDLQELAVTYRELGFNTVINEQGQPFPLNEGMELCVYKIVYEALRNVRKHAPVGTEISVDFLWVEDGLQVLIKDNGIELANRQKAGLGELVDGYTAQDDLDSLVSEFDGATLAALRDRAAIYKGRIEATMVAGVGFTLSAIFPNLKSQAVQDR